VHLLTASLASMPPMRPSSSSWRHRKLVERATSPVAPSCTYVQGSEFSQVGRPGEHSGDTDVVFERRLTQMQDLEVWQRAESAVHKVEGFFRWFVSYRRKVWNGEMREVSRIHIYIFPLLRVRFPKTRKKSDRLGFEPMHSKRTLCLDTTR